MSVTFRMYKLKQPLEKFGKHKGRRLRLLGFLLFYIQGAGMQVLLHPSEILVKELFFNKISALQPPNAIKTKFLPNSFQGFWLLFRNQKKFRRI